MLGSLIYSKMSFLQGIVTKPRLFLQISETWVSYQCSSGVAVVKLLFWHEKARCRRCRDRSRDLGASWLCGWRKICGLCKDQPQDCVLGTASAAAELPQWYTRRAVLIAASWLSSFCLITTVLLAQWSYMGRGNRHMYREGGQDLSQVFFLPHC